ncbi:MAG TPA: hypothetical protein VHH35_17180 [Pyrinomonadaceae bacterium]|nr:hypothetical protein [Pyrinomonadaceae bacterium]
MMNNEDLEQKMTFIVNQQAKFAVDIEKLHEAQQVTERTLSDANEVVNRLAYVTNFGFKDVNAKINALVDSQIRNEDNIKILGDSLKNTNEILNDLTESHRETQESVKRLSVAQEETDESLKELAVAQKETEQSLKELAESQKETDEEFRKLITRLDRRSNNGGNTS